ncbi:MAG: hypothetical protein EPN86_06475 [Nanoarchaeota archaeon]|nr:MAG: hypothetical protein EPN86_06475 [Nanoarchaeota archaeon]
MTKNERVVKRTVETFNGETLFICHFRFKSKGNVLITYPDGRPYHYDCFTTLEGKRGYVRTLHTNPKEHIPVARSDLEQY